MAKSVAQSLTGGRWLMGPPLCLGASTANSDSSTGEEAFPPGPAARCRRLLARVALLVELEQSGASAFAAVVTLALFAIDANLQFPGIGHGGVLPWLP